MKVKLFFFHVICSHLVQEEHKMHLTKKGGFCVCFRRDLLNKVVSFVFNALIDFFLEASKISQTKESSL